MCVCLSVSLPLCDLVLVPGSTPHCLSLEQQHQQQQLKQHQQQQQLLQTAPRVPETSVLLLARVLRKWDRGDRSADLHQIFCPDGTSPERRGGVGAVHTRTPAHARPHTHARTHPHCWLFIGMLALVLPETFEAETQAMHLSMLAVLKEFLVRSCCTHVHLQVCVCVCVYNMHTKANLTLFLLLGLLLCTLAVQPPDEERLLADANTVLRMVRSRHPIQRSHKSHAIPSPLHSPLHSHTGINNTLSCGQTCLASATQRATLLVLGCTTSCASSTTRVSPTARPRSTASLLAFAPQQMCPRTLSCAFHTLMCASLAPYAGERAHAHTRTHTLTQHTHTHAHAHSRLPMRIRVHESPGETCSTSTCLRASASGVSENGMQTLFSPCTARSADARRWCATPFAAPAPVNWTLTSR